MLSDMKSLTRPEAAVIALLHRGGDRTKVDTEDIALTAGETAPDLFSWVKYPQQIDKELVRVALSDAKLKKKWAIGSHAQGWMLTGEGIAYAKANEARALERAQETRDAGQSRDPEAAKERARLLGSEALAHARRDGVTAVTDDEADAFFHLISYIRGEARERKVTYVENTFRDDPELGPIVVALATRARKRGATA